MTSVGSMREKVTIQSEASTLNSDGETIPAWKDAFQVAAEVVELGGAETYRAGQVRTGRAYRVTIRYQDGVTEKSRFIWGGKTLEIDSTHNPDGRRRFLECMCREVV